MASAHWRADYPPRVGYAWRAAELGRVAHARLVVEGSPRERAACGFAPARGWLSSDRGRVRCGECLRLVDEVGR